MIKVFGLTDSEKWDEIVSSFKDYDTYWLSGYVKAFMLHGDGDPLLVYYEEKEGTRGINVVMKRDIANDPHFKGILEKDKYYDFATPYGYGGWLIEGKNTKQLFTDYFRWCNKNGIVSEFVRFHPLVSNHMSCSDEYEVIQLGQIVHMDLESKIVIWDNLTSKNRNVIRKAIKNDVKIYYGRFPEIYESFKEIYDSTMDKDNADDYYYFDNDFYKSILEDLPENAMVFYAMKDEKIIAASIILYANGRMNYHLSGSVKEYSSMAATNLLLLKAAEWGGNLGFNTFMLGGGVGSGEDSLFKFKRAFYKKDLNYFYIGKRIIDREKYEELCNMRGNIQKGAFFPEYRT